MGSFKILILSTRCFALSSEKMHVRSSEKLSSIFCPTSLIVICLSTIMSLLSSILSTQGLSLSNSNSSSGIDM